MNCPFSPMPSKKPGLKTALPWSTSEDQDPMRAAVMCWMLFSDELTSQQGNENAKASDAVGLVPPGPSHRGVAHRDGADAHDGRWPLHAASGHRFRQAGPEDYLHLFERE